MTETIKRHGFDFAQVPFSVIISKSLSSNAVRVYAYLSFPQGGKSTSWPGLEKITSETNLSTGTVKRALAELHNADYMRRQRRKRSSSITHLFANPLLCKQFDSRRITGDPTRESSRITGDPSLSRITGDPTERDTVNDSKEGIIPSSALFSTRDIQKAYEGCVSYKIDWVRGEGHAAKWLAENGYTPKDIIACYTDLKAQKFWSDKPLSLSSLKKQIGEWKTKKGRVIKLTNVVTA